MNQKRAQNSSEAPAPVCLLPGTPPPQGLLHQAIRAAGFVPLGQTLSESWSELGPEVQVDGDPAAAIGRQVHARRNEWRGFGAIAGWVGDLAKASNAAAAVLWFTEEDEARIWHLPRIRDALAEAGVPTLIMTRRDEQGADDAPAEIAAFLRGLAS